MLKESAHNITMDSQEKLKLKIHHCRLFRPKIHAVKLMAICSNTYSLAVVKNGQDRKEKDNLHYIEVYRTKLNSPPRLIHYFVDYEIVTGIAWIATDLILLVSRQQTINIYNVKQGQTVLSHITDYGPITGLKYDKTHGLLLTGTEYGYLVAYKVSPSNLSVEYKTKMVKLNSPICCIDFTVTKPSQVRSEIGGHLASKKSKKRKREDDSMEEEIFMASCSLTIYAASQTDVISFNFHEKTIIDTIHLCGEGCNVLSLSILNNGDFIAGDSDGYISLYDNSTLTCRQRLKVLESEVLCIAIDSSTIYVSGKDPTIVKLEHRPAEKIELVLLERNQTHTHKVTCLAVSSPQVYYSGSIDGFISKHTLTKKGIMKLRKDMTPPNYINRVKIYSGEIMFQHEKDLTMWRLPDSKSCSADGAKPTKHLLIRAKNHILSSAFSDKWIVYATKKDLYIFDRSDGEMKPYKPSRQLPSCHALEFDSGNQVLAAASGNHLHIIDMNSRKVKNTVSTYSVSSSTQFRGFIKQMLFMPKTGKLIVIVGHLGHQLIALEVKNRVLENHFKFQNENIGLLFMNFNRSSATDTNVYFYTTKNQILKVESSNFDGLNHKALDKPAISNLPEDSVVMGMLPLSNDQCMLYDSSHIFRVDLSKNQLISTNTDYSFVVKLDNLFEDSDQVALIEHRKEDYIRSIPVPGFKGIGNGSWVQKV